MLKITVDKFLHWRLFAGSLFFEISYTETAINAFRAMLKATFHLTIFMSGQRETGKIQRSNYHHGNRGPSLTGKTSSVSLIFTHQTHRNVKTR